ncbi:iron-sulfur cluster carrier protein [Anaplasma platys]|uniref:Iron-sulfur cluster carrier protein n=1 Tax=Anaplasma platys TaxID=949 RepID=A0A858PZ02_9RICK|nr:Mrp/NBP35 family ATP-binding protein [Anaplasma platys]QJC27841.1 iron-sulfur cluster carrier protein [Anaplasma platys]
MITERKVTEALEGVTDPDSGVKISAIGTLSVTINKGDVGVILRVNAHKGSKWEQQLKRDCRDVITSRLSGITNVTVALIQDKIPRPLEKIKVSGVREVLMVASGKGGVGKSTVSVQLALTLAGCGYKVALVDADIYGPSVPQLLGTQLLAAVDDAGFIVPLEMRGVSSISIGNLVQDDTRAIAWRGPMVTKAINKLITGTRWRDIDYMVIDTPPGTGDVHISLTRSYEITGGIIVTTPHELSVTHAMKTCDMLRSMQVRLLGVVENMSYVLDQKSGQKMRIFGNSGGRVVAEKNSVPLLGEVGICPGLTLNIEHGHAGPPDSGFSEIFKSIAGEILGGRGY